MRSSLRLGKTNTTSRIGLSRLGTAQNVRSSNPLAPTNYASANLCKSDLGKFMNGYTLANYMHPPKGFDYTDVLVRLIDY